jgi:hypothetical protein
MKRARKKARRRETGKTARPGIASAVKVNRKRVTVSALAAPADDVDYWRSRSPGERLQHVEFLRLINYGQAAVSGRLKRVLEVAQLETR